MTATNLDRIAELEKAVVALSERLAALEGKPRRDPASTTSHRGELGPGRTLTSPHKRREIEPPFGFGLPGAYVGGASVDEDVRDERWRDAQT